MKIKNHHSDRVTYKLFFLNREKSADDNKSFGIYFVVVVAVVVVDCVYFHAFASCFHLHDIGRLSTGYILTSKPLMQASLKRIRIHARIQKMLLEGVKIRQRFFFCRW